MTLKQKLQEQRPTHSRLNSDVIDYCEKEVIRAVKGWLQQKRISPFTYAVRFRRELLEDLEESG